MNINKFENFILESWYTSVSEVLQVNVSAGSADTLSRELFHF
jgi:hypothetical protein